MSELVRRVVQSLRPYHDADPEDREHLPDMTQPEAFNPWALVWIVPLWAAMGLGINALLDLLTPGIKADLWEWAWQGAVLVLLWNILKELKR